ncbi:MULTISPECIES: stage V sporulation protein AA [unclassified Bacillus (in: firmicutes)]|uniref:stage V sporulation protein AA n=1 Tax=unclassified Bacillus (in: firmicutes) TaxID=185979 RepID=UPI000BEF92EF|nr:MULTISPECIES: stage V sporulation protein AA [unclassified Bacillus (in: firmicutes)]PEJ53702.1 stage V sporulation protein AA [Bacillus sp. AFS002410]PEK98122.1 stage V sporulation protein AA [Bacillus sp. AFS017336]
MKKVLYIKLLNRVVVQVGKRVLLEDIARLQGINIDISSIKNIIVHESKKEDGTHTVIDILDLLPLIQEVDPDISFELVGVTMCILELKNTVSKDRFILFCFVWILLFTGSSLAIIYFHEDVSMQQVQQRIYYMITGEYNHKPLLLQVPYSFGLGIGMILFFNQWFKTRLNEEPSPLEVEMFQYQRSMDEYVLVNENKKPTKSVNTDD